jgi:hypothetical protein
LPTSIADLWFLTYDNRPTDIRAPLFSSRQIEGEVRRANAERRCGRTDWTAIDLEEVILICVTRAAEIASVDPPKKNREPLRSERIHLRAVPSSLTCVKRNPADKGRTW